MSDHSKALATEREKFEAWGNAKGAHIERSWNGECYENRLVESAWQGWCTRASLISECSQAQGGKK